MGIISEFLFSSLTGAIGGIVASAILFWISLKQKKKRESLQRKEQIDYILNLVVKYRKTILERKLSEDIPVVPMYESEELFRHRVYEALRTELESTLSGRAKQLTFDEIEEIKKLFRIGPYKLNPDRGLSNLEYIEMFRKAESVKWLNLPHEPK